MEYVVRQISLTNYDHLNYFIFDLDDGKDMCYRSRVSANYFFHGSKMRNRHDSLFIGSHNNRFEQKRTTENIALFGNIPVIRLNNLWEFYTAIDYDYKRQRWL